MANTVKTAAYGAGRPSVGGRLASDTWTSMLRVLLNYRHSPGLLAASLGVPVVMVVVFGYVFGSAMQVPGGGDYREFLMPGLFAMVATNGVMPTMVGAARDVGRGVTDRLRSMPVSRTGLLLGQTLADLLVSVVVLALLALVGLAAGWRARHGVADALGAFALLLLFRFVMTWLGTLLGLAVGKEEAAGQLSVVVFPLAMVTNAYVPTGGMPGWLRTVADWNPISSVVEAARGLFGNPSAPGAAWPMQHAVLATLLWSGLLLAVCGPLAVRKFATHGR
ncbi:ABC-2 type transport system permease protein [Streptomyces sp. 1114.5]|uniref:ABC transporter permease n=1 Tax=unclassified Streptomyces TaxID=2593676 RepID=UPI000BD56DB8|nr:MULTISPECIES: ABC transporter permease [unclassified Streptomyces]RKT18999.1 ABC-2 type transport system permease protein [Streptomyces sp. 1114.5]SOB85199.1 ABC-2 type transport system permease protein [Streptomyces sp. 1331.2]